VNTAVAIDILQGIPIQLEGKNCTIITLNLANPSKLLG
jgi:hypothetical protein